MLHCSNMGKPALGGKLYEPAALIFSLSGAK